MSRRWERPWQLPPWGTHNDGARLPFSENVWELDRSCLEPSRAAEPSCFTVSWRSCVSEAASPLPLSQASGWLCLHRADSSRFLSSGFKLGFWRLTVPGLCWGCDAHDMWTALFSVLYGTHLRDQEVDWGLRGSLLSGAEQRFLNILVFAFFSLCCVAVNARTPHLVFEIMVCFPRQRICQVSLKA